MSNSLTDFLVQLAGDSELQSKFEADPTATMNQAGLNQQEQDALQSGDHMQIGSLLDFEGHSGFVPICFCRKH